MTDENIDLRSLLEKAANTGFRHKMIGISAQRLMELEAESLTGAHSTRVSR